MRIPWMSSAVMIGLRFYVKYDLESFSHLPQYKLLSTITKVLALVTKMKFLNMNVQNVTINKVCRYFDPRSIL